MKNNQIPKKPSFWNWIHNNRLKIVALGFIIIVPIALILSIYIGSFTNNRKIYFDPEVTDETVIISDYQKINPKDLNITDDYYYQIDTINEFDLFIRWEEINMPVKNSTTGELENGSYRFKTYYQPKNEAIVSSVTIIPLLQTDWTDIRSLGSSLLIGTVPPTNAFLTVQFNEVLPVSPLLFVKVETPHLYMKITYNLNVSGTTESKTVYVQYDLDQINPRVVLPIT